MFKRITLIAVLLIILFTVTGSALAQDYSFRLDRHYVDAYWNADGTLSLYYRLTFTNDPGAHEIDFVDLGLPNEHFYDGNIIADVDGDPVAYVSEYEYQGSGTGVAIALGENSIAPGETATVNVRIDKIGSVLFTDDKDKTYASAVFVPTWFGSQYVHGNTDFEVTFHLPPGVQPEEPRWHAAPKGFPEQPVTGHDSEGRITYIWRNTAANGHTAYKFGASFPAKYVPADAITTPTFFDRHNIHIRIDLDAISDYLCLGGFVLVFVGSIVAGRVSARKQRMKYLPPKIRIEGHGIKRGLTAIEAAVLMEHPPDKILTMILFSVVKKGAARVVSRDPVKLEIADPLPEGLRTYEVKFLEAFQEKNTKKRRKELQNLMVWLIRSVSKKMKGFSHKETVAYYRKIMEKAWQQVENADTPEVKSEKFDEHMGWTMLDDEFDRRTEEVFRSGPVYVPAWWGHYDPTWSGGGAKPLARPSASGSGSGGGISLPTLPGGAFAASMVGGIQNFASDVVGNVTHFTSDITRKTNPSAASSGSSSGWSSGGSSCACACACAGCACACAGGGR